MFYFIFWLLTFFWLLSHFDVNLFELDSSKGDWFAILLLLFLSLFPVGTLGVIIDWFKKKPEKISKKQDKKYYENNSSKKETNSLISKAAVIGAAAAYSKATKVAKTPTAVPRNQEEARVVGVNHIGGNKYKIQYQIRHAISGANNQYNWGGTNSNIVTPNTKSFSAGSTSIDIYWN